MIIFLFLGLYLPHTCTYSSNGLSPCSQCPEGQYQSQYGSTSCVRCLSVDDNPVFAPSNYYKWDLF